MKKKINENKLKELYESYDKFIDLKSEKFLNHDYFHSHITFSRNHLIGTNILSYYLKDKTPEKKILNFINQTFLFYLKNLFNFFLWFIYFVYSKLFIKKNVFKVLKNTNIFIQTFLNSNSFDEKYSYKDNYFKELYDYLVKKSENYVIIANISEPVKNLKKRFQLLNNFKNNNQHIICEFDVLNICDLFKIFKFIFSFPWIVLFYVPKKKSKSYLDKLFNFDYINTISNSSFLTYVQFLFGKRLSKLMEKNKTKIISWNENQLIHRNFLRGVRSKNITVYGCQYFLKYPSCRWMYFRKSDEKYNVIPNKILVSGEIYLSEEKGLNYVIGSPFRYRDVFKDVKINKSSKKILLLLPYEQKESAKIIEFVKKANLSDDYTIHLKIHPYFINRKKFYQKIIFNNWVIKDKNFNTDEYALIVSKASGSIVEYIARCCSVVILDDDNPLVLNPLISQTGKGINYDYIDHPDQLYLKINNLIKIRESKFDEFLKNAHTLRTKYFSEVSTDKLIRDFEF